MKKIILMLPIFATLSFAKININEANRYELIKFGKFNDEDAALVIKYRKDNDIVSIQQLRKIVKIKQSDSDMDKIFEFKKTSKNKLIKKTIKPYKNGNHHDVKIEKIITSPYGYKKIYKDGNKKIIESSYPNHKNCIGEDCKVVKKYKKHYDNGDFDSSDIDINGEIKIKIDKNL